MGFRKSCLQSISKNILLLGDLFIYINWSLHQNIEVGGYEICPLHHYIAALFDHSCLLTDRTLAAEPVPYILEFVQVGHIVDGV